MATLLQVQDLHASVDGKEILQGLNLEIKAGETHVLMGPNGAGKSTLMNVVMGNPEYKVESGSVCFNGEEITHAKTDVRAKKGIFMSFQTPEEVPGVLLEDFLRLSKSTVSGKPQRIFGFKKELQHTMAELQMDAAYANRYLNVGFSGGEKKKAEILQMLTLQPKLAMLDETDSGLDVDAVKIVSEGIRKFKNADNALLIITHNAKILEDLQVDFVHVLAGGKIIKTGGPELIDEIGKYGFHSLEAGEARE